MGKVEIPNWLKDLPLAPEFRPTDTEFGDPVAYISKIEKEASAFGICKIIPPLPRPSKRYVFANLNKSLLKCPELGDINSFAVCNSLKTVSGDSGIDGEMPAVFTTRQQELGSEKRTKGTTQNQLSGAHKQVWQSGEIYTLEQFESKSKAFARSILGTVKDVSPLIIEAMFWKAASEKPIYIEYANDVPGSAFGESKGQFHYIHKRRRKSAYYKRSLDRFDCKKTEIDGLSASQTDRNKDASTHAETCLHTSNSTTTLSTFSSNEAPHSSRQRGSDASNEMEGTAGWKLSNSPWNLQVIARSLGSLTRFMPDDIPGVTSPMVYIGMLFSWFAWHVEDHELHSMNFLHTGSPKTWYAVPGDYALSFEEVIRSEAYGGSIDHLAALTLLGEKTTLLSPEVVVASGIPCCRLIQNPGEFVVTFPRAYHVGFSHGFNCGEAANFGTPQWLKVAKEAAVRRAVMNYLPMLSHQQLLYLLTMSFVSRVPRTLLPGVRSSRSRDRQREERELLVKKAFIEDILQENNLLSGLIGENPHFRAVLWNADLLPDSSKDPQLPDLVSSAGTSMADNMPNISADKSNNYLLDEMSLCMENLTDLYQGDDDLPSHFQTDSGALACISCGILGFPFMTVVQPSEKSLMELLSVNHLVQNSSLDPVASMQVSISGPSLTKELPKPSLLQFNRCWNTNCKSFRPRIFCLEHGLQIVKKLQCKGGVNLLVICHSDYQKIKAHAGAVAEEIGSAFDYHEVSLEVASPEDLSLIDMAIDNDEHNDCEEDWTSKLGINLHYCVNARKNPQSKQAPYPLALGMLFPHKGPGSESLSFNWQTRKLRSKKSNHFAWAKACDRVQRKKDGQLEGRVDGSPAKKENLIQYSRRKFKSRETCFSGARVFHESVEKSKNVSSTLCGNLHNQESNNQLDTENTRSDCTVSCVSASNAMIQMHHQIQVTDVATSIRFNTFALQPSKSFPDSTSMDENVAAEVENQIVQKLDIDGRNSLATPNHFIIHNKISASEMPSQENQISHDKECSSSLTIATEKKIEMLDTSKKGNSLDLLDEVHQELQSRDKVSNKEAVSSTVSLLNQPALASMDGNYESPRKNCGAESAMCLEETDVLENITLNGSDKLCIPSYDIPINEHTSNNEAFEAPTELYTAADVCKEAAMDIEQQQEMQITNCDDRERDLFTNHSVKQQSVQIGKYAEGLKYDMILESEKQHQIPTKITTINKEPAPSHGGKWENKNVTTPEVLCSEVSMKTCPGGDLLSSQSVSDQKEQLEVQRRSKGERCSGTETLLKESSVSIQEFCTVEKGTCSLQDIIGTEVHSSQDNREQSCELTTIVPRSNSGKKRRREVEQITKNNSSCYSFVRSPCEGLRPRAGKVAMGGNENDPCNTVKENLDSKRARRPSGGLPPSKNKKDDAKKSHKCDLDGCHMTFKTKAELILHKRNRCPHEGCGKKFSSHKYALLHHRVHDDERPLKCPWKGCTMSFKWAWARTEHIRVHTGEKPYKCKVEGCGLSFRFISDYSRHRRKTGHYVNSPA